MKKTKKSGTAKGAEPKEHLIEAFLKLAQQKGAAAMTIQLIADEANMSFGAVRYHFNPEEIKIEAEALKFLIQKCYVYLEEKIFVDRTGLDFNPLYSYLENMLRWVHDYPRYSSFLIYYYYMCTTEIELPISNEAFVQRAQIRIESLLNEGIGLGLYRPFTEKATLSSLLHEAIMGASIILATQMKKGSKVRLEDHIAKCKMHADLLIGGFGQVKDSSLSKS